MSKPENAAKQRQKCREHGKRLRADPVAREKLNAVKRANAQKRLAENPEYRAAKLARDNETRRLRKAANPEWKDIHNKRAREYADKYPEKIRALRVARKARVRAADGSFSGAEWLACLERYRWQCPQCGVPLHDSGTVDDIDGKRKATVDHVVPLKHGGTNWIANIQPMCMTCNTSKQDHSTVLLAPWAGRPVEVFREDLATKGWVRAPEPESLGAEPFASLDQAEA